MWQNKFNKIQLNTFQHFKRLKKLRLYSNQIEQINSNGFQG
jgi:hypothetical protein